MQQSTATVKLNSMQCWWKNVSLTLSVKLLVDTVVKWLKRFKTVWSGSMLTEWRKERRYWHTQCSSSGDYCSPGCRRTAGKLSSHRQACADNAIIKLLDWLAGSGLGSAAAANTDTSSDFLHRTDCQPGQQPQDTPLVADRLHPLKDE